MIAVLICFLLMLTLHLATPFWWWIMTVPFLFGLIKSRSARESLKVGTASAGMLWFFMGLYQWATASQQASDRVLAMMGAGANGAWLLIATTLLALLAAAISGLSGHACKAAWAKHGSRN